MNKLGLKLIMISVILLSTSLISNSGEACSPYPNYQIRVTYDNSTTNLIVHNFLTNSIGNITFQIYDENREIVQDAPTNFLEISEDDHIEFLQYNANDTLNADDTIKFDRSFYSEDHSIKFQIGEYSCEIPLTEGYYSGGFEEDTGYRDLYINIRFGALIGMGIVCFVLVRRWVKKHGKTLKINLNESFAIFITVMAIIYLFQFYNLSSLSLEIVILLGIFIPFNIFLFLGPVSLMVWWRGETDQAVFEPKPSRFILSAFTVIVLASIISVLIDVMWLWGPYFAYPVTIGFLKFVGIWFLIFILAILFKTVSIGRAAVIATLITGMNPIILILSLGIGVYTIGICLLIVFVFLPGVYYWYREEHKSFLKLKLLRSSNHSPE